MTRLIHSAGPPALPGLASGGMSSDLHRSLINSITSESSLIPICRVVIDLHLNFFCDTIGGNTCIIAKTTASVKTDNGLSPGRQVGSLAYSVRNLCPQRSQSIGYGFC